MNRYDQSRACPKCGCAATRNEHLGVGYCGGGALIADYVRVDPERLRTAFPERIHRTCFNCKYSWDELPLDASA